MDTCFYYFFDFFLVVLCSGEASYGFFPFDLFFFFCFGFVVFSEKKLLFWNRVFQWLAHCLMMACKMVKIDKFTIS